MNRNNPLSTYVFATDARRGAGPLSLGVGADVDAARADAIARHAKRYGPHQVRDCEELQAHLKALEQATAHTTHVMAGAYASQEQMGHAYLSFTSEAVSAAFASDASIVRIVEHHHDSPEAVRRALRPLVGRYVDALVPRELIDWYEVREEVLGEGWRERLRRREGRGAPAPEPPRDATVKACDPKAAPEREIPAEVRAVLARVRVDGSRVYLPEVRLERGLYDRVNEVLVALGGRWRGGKVQAHEFEEPDVAIRLEIAVATGSFLKPQDFGYFPTPPELARQVVRMAGIQPGMRVLEPSAGRGALATLAAEEAGGKQQVDCFEVLPANAQALRKAGFERVFEEDFLGVEPQPVFDICVMNPPFNSGVDVRHVMHATRFLQPHGRLVAITSCGWTFGSRREQKEFADFVADCEADVVEVAAGAFAESGTQVRTCIVAMDASRFPWNRREEARERMRA